MCSATSIEKSLHVYCTTQLRAHNRRLPKLLLRSKSQILHLNHEEVVRFCSTSKKCRWKSNSARQCRLRISLKTQKAITKLRWTVLPLPPRSPYSVPSDFHLFQVLKNSKCGEKWTLFYYQLTHITLKNAELLKHSKLDKNFPTCFGLHRNHLKGAKVSAWLDSIPSHTAWYTRLTGHNMQP